MEEEQAVKINSRRYAHQKCVPECTELVPLPDKKKSDDLVKLKDFIKELIGEQANWPIIMRQITNLKEKNGYTYSGILKTLNYYFKVKGNKLPENKNLLLTFVPYHYEDAKRYYYDLFIISQQVENDNEIYTPVVKEIIIKPPVWRRKVKLFDLGEEVIKQDE